MLIKEKIQNNLNKIKSYLPINCELIAVSKYVSSDEIRLAYECGQRDFGENRVPDLIRNRTYRVAEIRWHMIGNIQSNKIKNLLSVKNLYAVHSLYEKNMLKFLTGKQKILYEFFFQVNIPRETKRWSY